MNRKPHSVIKSLAATAIYAAFAIYLYQPALGERTTSRWEYLFLINAPLAAMGCYVLSRRWMSSFLGSFFAGAIYGFGPFMLGLARFHPTAGFLAATVPWLFCPAAFIPRQKWRLVEILLSLLPYLTIVVFFQVSLHYRLFAVPARARLHLADLLGLIAPLAAAKRGLLTIGFYHIAIAPLIIGFSMLLKAKRTGIMAILASAVVLAICKPILGVSSIIWLAIPVVCCSVLVGAGTQGLILAGFADRKWVLSVAGICVALAIITILLATKYFQTFLALGTGCARIFTDTGKMYALGAIILLFLFFLVRANLRLAWLRGFILCSAMAVDIFLGARFIVDRLL